MKKAPSLAAAVAMLASACATPGVNHSAQQRDAEIRRQDAAVRSARDRCSYVLSWADGAVLFVNTALLNGLACASSPGLARDLDGDLRAISSACNDPRLKGDVVTMNQARVMEDVEDARDRLSLVCQR